MEAVWDVVAWVEQLPLGGNILCFLCLAVFDVLVACRTRARWFCLHAFGNLVVVVGSFPAVVATLTDPLHACDSRVHSDASFLSPASLYSIYMVNSLHVYHMACFSKLSAEELFHHLLFIPTVGFVGQYYSWGACCGFLCFFISGLPGGIDYTLLMLMKHKKLEKLTEKNWNAFLNIGVRAPGIITWSVILYVAQLYRNTTVPWWAATMLMSLAAYNALYYCDQSIANFATHKALGRSVVERKSTVAGMDVPVIETPQRPLYDDSPRKGTSPQTFR